MVRLTKFLLKAVKKELKDIEDIERGTPSYTPCTDYDSRSSSSSSDAAPADESWILQEGISQEPTKVLKTLTEFGKRLEGRMK